MDYYAYLNTQSKDIVRMLISSKFHMHENIGLCNNNKQFFGYGDLPRLLVLCTENIKRSGFNVKDYVNETIVHESVHAAQVCNHSQPFGIKNSLMPLPRNKLSDVENSLKLVKSYKNRQREHEAYFYEGKPKDVLRLLKKYCL